MFKIKMNNGEEFNCKYGNREQKIENFIYMVYNYENENIHNELALIKTIDKKYHFINKNFISSISEVE